MPELPEVETVRRMVAARVVGRTMSGRRLFSHGVKEPPLPHVHGARRRGG